MSEAFRINQRCINCGTCWQFNPQHFARGDGSARVQAQPLGIDELEQALLALQACPVAAIETSPQQRRQLLSQAFPLPVTTHPAGEVFYCGWASKQSFGACS